MHRLGRPVALAAAAVVVALLACELGARLFLPPPRYHDAPVELDSELGFRGVPDFRQQLTDVDGPYEVALNHQGLRGRELPAAGSQAVPGALRVLFVGDSFLVGQAVREEQLAPSRVEASLRARDRDALAYNLSAIDWGTAQELLALRRYGPALAPDVVVLFVYPANDLINNSRGLAERTTVSAGDRIRPYLEVEGGELRVRYLRPGWAWLRRHSRLFATLERRVLAASATPVREDYAERLQQRRAPREDFEIFRSHAEPGDPWREAWQQSFELLRAFRRECDALGARLLVVVVPNVHQVVRNAKGIRLDALSRGVRGIGLDAILDWNLPERELARFLAQEGIETRLLLGPLREAAAEGAVVYTRDEHLSSRGHEIAAAEVEIWLGDGDAAPAAPTTDPPGGPIRALPPASEAPALLDFGAERHLEPLGDGWISWSGPGEGHRGRWLIGPNALAVLAVRDGDLVVRGEVPPQARLPISGQLAVVGGTRFPFRIETPGPFALRFAVPPDQRRGWARSDGYIAVVLAPGETHRAGGVIPAGLNVEALGFAPPASNPPPAAARDWAPALRVPGSARALRAAPH
jgi:hypothetical protein